MVEACRFPFTRIQDSIGDWDLVPKLPIRLSNGNQHIEVKGLLDTGSSVNVLPYSIGLDLGAIWENQTLSLRLTGNLARVEARGLALQGQVGNFTPTNLVFAWSQTDNVPLLFGRMNFFQEFDVCFYRSQASFDVRPKQ